MSVLGEVRRPAFLIALFAMVLVVMVEIGSAFMLGGGSPGPVGPLASGMPGIPADMIEGVDGDSPPGSGIAYLVLVDGFLLFSVVMLGVSLLVSQRVYGRVQGVVTLVFSFLWLIAAVAMAFAALGLLLVMVGLFVATPFGTIAYLAIWGFFPTGRAAAMLGLLLFLKLVFLGFLVLAQQRFLNVVPLMLHIAVSFVLQLVLGLIHGFLPFVVVSIGDQFWALVTAVVAATGALVSLVASIPAVVNAVRVSKSRQQ